MSNLKNNNIINIKSNIGFSLIEVLIAISLVSTGLLAVANMQITSLKVSSNSSNITKSTTILQDTVEHLMSLPYTDDLLVDNSEPGIFETYFHPSPPFGYIIKWEIDASEELDTAGVLPVKKYLNVTTQWSSGQEMHSISFPLVLTKKVLR